MNIVVCRRRGEQNKILEKTPARVRKKKTMAYTLYTITIDFQKTMTRISSVSDRVLKTHANFFLSTISRKKIERDQQYTKILCYLPC